MEGEFSLFFPFNQNSFIFGHRSSLKILPGPWAELGGNFILILDPPCLSPWKCLVIFAIKRVQTISHAAPSQCSALFSNLIEKITQVPLLTADKVALFTTQILYSDKKSSIETAREPRRAGGLYSNVYDFASIMSALLGIMKPLIGGQEERQTNDGPVLGDDVRNFPNDSCILYILRSWRLVPPTRVKHLY